MNWSVRPSRALQDLTVQCVKKGLCQGHVPPALGSCKAWPVTRNWENSRKSLLWLCGVRKHGLYVRVRVWVGLGEMVFRGM